MKIWIFLIALCATTPAHAQQSPDVHHTNKEIALMAGRVTVSEVSLRPQCVPWEMRRYCVNDMAAILQRTEYMSGINHRDMYDELRAHSPRATGRCVDLMSHGLRGNALPKRCRYPASGNSRWSYSLSFDLRETDAWRSTVTLPWESRRGRGLWEQTLSDAFRWLQRPWYPCEHQPEAWGGSMDHPGAGLIQTSCGPTRNSFFTRMRNRRLPIAPESLRPRIDRASIPAGVARGDG